VKKSLLILPLVVIVAALGLAACGGGSSSSGSGGDEASIEEAIEESATSSEPSKCTEFQTAAFNETETGESGAAATKTCEKEAEEEESPAESVSISGISVNGESATAEVEVTGSALNGQGVELELVQEEGDWKLNKFLALTNFDGAALGEALEEQLAGEEGVTPELAKCVSEGVAEISQEEAESMIFDKKLEPVEEVVASCE
jgi:predicted small secreted protein